MQQSNGRVASKTEEAIPGVSSNSKSGNSRCPSIDFPIVDDKYTPTIRCIADSISTTSGIDIRQVNADIGNGIFATRNYNKGELVFTDSPIVTCQFAWNQLYKYKACEYCLRALETAEENAQRLTGNSFLHLPFPDCCETKNELHIPCDECEQVYCSTECRSRAWTEYHSILCLRTRYPLETHPQKVLDLYWRMMHYPPETFSIFLLVKLLVKLHLDSDGSLRKRLGAFCSSPTNDTEKLVHRLLGDEHVLRIINLREMVKNVVNFDNIQEFLQPEAFLELFILVGRNGQGVGTSSFAAWVDNMEKLEMSPEEKKTIMDSVDQIYQAMDSHVGHFMDNEGSALYPLQSWVNHSCVANTEVKFPYKNHILGLVASRDIQAGEEFTISYLDLGDLERSRYARNKYLKEHYLFECHCPKCLEQADDEDVTTEEEEDSNDGDEMNEDDNEWSDIEDDNAEEEMTTV